MSGFDYKSSSSYAEGSHPEYITARPIISYNAACSTRTYVRRVEATSYKNSTSPVNVKVDTSMEKYNRPREVDDFITQILNEVNGFPGLATSPNTGSTWGRHSSPVKVYPSRDYKSNYYSGSSPKNSMISGDHGDPYDHGDEIPGHDYDRPPQISYGAPNKQYWGQRDKSLHPAYDQPSHYKSPTKLEIDHEVPKNQQGNASIKFLAPRDDEVHKNHWGKSSSYIDDDHSPKNPSSKISKEHGGTHSRWGNSVGKPQSPKAYEIPSNRWDRLSSYDHPHSGKSQPPHNYGIPNNQWDRSSSPIHEYLPPSGNSGGVSNTRWGSSIMKPQSPKDHGVSYNQLDRSSSPIYDHPPPTKNIGGVPSNRWGDLVMKPQPLKDHGVHDNQWDTSSNPDYNQPQPTRSNPWGNSSMKPQSPKDHGVPNNQWDRSSSPVGDYPPPTRNIGGVLSSRWGNSLMKPQSPKDHGVPTKEWDRSSSPVYDHPPAARNTRGFPNNRWDNSMVKPQSLRDDGVPNNGGDKSSNPIHDNSPTIRDTNGAPNSRWGSSSVKPHSPKNHGVSNPQWDRSSSSVHSHPGPREDGEKVVNSRWPNSPTKPQSFKDHGVPDDKLEKQSIFAPERPAPSVNIGGVPNNRWSNHPQRPESPKGYNQWDRSSSPVQVPNSKLGNSPVKSQSPKAANSSYDEPIGNNNSLQMKKPVDYSYDHQPKEYRSSNGIKPSNYQPSTLSQTTTPLGKKTSNIGDSMQQPKKSVGALPEGAARESSGIQPRSSFPTSEEHKRETKAGPIALDSAEVPRRYGGHDFPGRSYRQGLY